MNVRLLAATNRDLLVESGEGRFRDDLLYRINVVHLHLSPLRQRREDIPLLATRFVKKYSVRYGLAISGLSPEVMECLMRYSFPGNVRELENVVEGALALTVEGRVELDALPSRVTNPAMEKGTPFQLPENGMDLEAYLAQIESRAIEQALTLCHGSKTKAAELLGMSFRSFRYRMAKLEEKDQL